MSERAVNLLKAMKNYLPGDEGERRDRLVRLLDRVIDEKALDYLSRNYQGQSWKVLMPLREELLGMEEAQRSQQVSELKRKKG